MGTAHGAGTSTSTGVDLAMFGCVKCGGICISQLYSDRDRAKRVVCNQQRGPFAVTGQYVLWYSKGKDEALQQAAAQLRAMFGPGRPMVFPAEWVRAREVQLHVLVEYVQQAESSEGEL